MPNATRTRTPDKYINALPKNRVPQGAIALGVLLIHARTNEEMVVDLLVEDDSLPTMFRGLHVVGGISRIWKFEESWDIDTTAFCGRRNRKVRRVRRLA